MINLPKEYEWVDLSDPNFNKALELILHSDQNLNIIGCAGSGKSTLLKLAYSLLGDQTVVLSSTGISAANLSARGIKGSTIHSFFKLPPLNIFPDSIGKNNRVLEDILVNIDTILIDEVSMVPAALMDKMLQLLYEYRTNHDMDLPRVILFSDILQLPCIVDKDNPDVYSYYEKMYEGNTFFFNSVFYQQHDFMTINLNHIYRQKDTSFQNILNRIRQGTQTNEDLQIINQQVISEEEYFIHNELYIYLASTNAVADSINDSYLSTYPGMPRQYKGYTTGRFDLSKIPQLSNLVTLKKEMQIMCLKNNSENGYQNGTLGTIEDMYYDSIKINTKNGRTNVVRENWDQYEYGYNEIAKEVIAEKVGTFNQIAAKPASAITIHKSQGLEFDNVYINLGFVTQGLTYVALSRCRTLEGIGLDHPIRHTDIRVAREALDFLEKQGV